MFEPLQTGRSSARSVWTTALSFAVQGAGIVVLVLIPLLYTSAIPFLRVGEPLSLPPSAHHHLVRLVTENSEHHAAAQPSHGPLVAPTSIPPQIASGPEPAPAPETADDGPEPSGVLDGPSSRESNLPPGLFRPAPPPVTHAPVIHAVSVVELGSLERKVQPIYPAAARIARVQGDVVLRALIDTRGEVAQIQVMRGNPLLVAAAVDAIRQWRYKPYRLNGQWIEVETEITVHFTLDR